MTETRAIYEHIRKDLGEIRNETLLLYNQGWVQPTPDELRFIIDYANTVESAKKLTGSELGNLVGVDARTVRRWTAPIDAKNHRDIPYAAWRLLLQYIEVVNDSTLTRSNKAAE